jgi:hypothetical protein
MGGSAPVAGVKVMTKGTGGGFDSSDDGMSPVMLVMNPEAGTDPGCRSFRPGSVVRLHP